MNFASVAPEEADAHSCRHYTSTSYDERITLLLLSRRRPSLIWKVIATFRLTGDENGPGSDASSVTILPVERFELDARGKLAAATHAGLDRVEDACGGLPGCLGVWP